MDFKFNSELKKKYFIYFIYMSYYITFNILEKNKNDGIVQNKKCSFSVLGNGANSRRKNK